jgi:predicted DNA-binding transcriptional regulator YafY
MTINLSKMEQIDQLIATKNTGTPNSLAERVGVSSATLYRYLNTMKEAGAPIKYDRIKETYLYLEPGRTSLRFYSGTN